MKGKVSQWNDEKGFGFISIQDKQGRVFFHISSIKTRERRPEIGDSVDFEINKDENGKVRATSVFIDGLSSTTSSGKINRIKIDPPQKNIFDYFLYLVILASISYTVYQFYLSRNIETLWPYVIPAVITFFLLGRSKKPKQEHYSCTKCKAVERFNSRTIAAWNRGITRLFCNKCHKDWIKDKPRERSKRASSSRVALMHFWFYPHYL